MKKLCYTIDTTLRRVKGVCACSKEDTMVLGDNDEIVYLPTKLNNKVEELLENADYENHVITRNIDGTLDFPSEHYNQQIVKTLNKELFKYKD